jgi:hypothetical protein
MAGHIGVPEGNTSKGGATVSLAKRDSFSFSFQKNGEEIYVVGESSNCSNILHLFLPRVA